MRVLKHAPVCTLTGVWHAVRTKTRHEARELDAYFVKLAEQTCRCDEMTNHMQKVGNKREAFDARECVMMVEA